MTQTSLIIVGGGPAGCELAKTLDAELDVTLVEPREAFVHAPAMIRSLIDPSLLETALIPYDRLLKRGTIVAQRAASVDETGVQLADGAQLLADFIVVATGSSNGALFKPRGASIPELKAQQIDFNQHLLDAERILIVGAGAVGVELAGEIASAMPHKHVILVSSGSTLFPEKPERLGRTLLKKLRHMGVEVLLGERALLGGESGPRSDTVELSNGHVLQADLVVRAIGAKPNNELLVALPDAKAMPDGRVWVDGYMRPSSHPNLFAIGDVADAGDAPTIVAIGRQQPWLAKTLRSLSAGKPIESLEPYVPWKSAPILLPLGPKRGSSYLGIATFGDWVTRNLKGSDLFIPKYRKLLNQS